MIIIEKQIFTYCFVVIIIQNYMTFKSGVRSAIKR